MDKKLVFKDLKQDKICEVCIENFKSFLYLKEIDPSKEYFCKGCEIKILAKKMLEKKYLAKAS